MKNKWQEDILKSLENNSLIDFNKWKTLSESDDTGIEFMEKIATDKYVYEHLDSRRLVNRGFCPINGEQIDNTAEYLFFDRGIYLSKSAMDISKAIKIQKQKEFDEKNREYKANAEKAKAFLEQVNPSREQTKPLWGKNNPYAKEAKNYENPTFFLVLILSVFGSYKIVNPSSILGYVGTVLLFILLFNIGDWLRKKL